MATEVDFTSERYIFAAENVIKRTVDGEMSVTALLIHNKAEAEWKHRFESFVCVFVERGAFRANESYLYSASYVSTVILSRLIKSILLLIWADIFIDIWVSLPWAISFLGATTIVAPIEFYGQLSNSGCRFTKNFVHGVWLAVVA
ncbi:hypothetical protein T02_952 [Trichinella nativa]|uniref:Uncharacterized protein n=1 Tax=Trichinella nativa TaxID=6335 RepID=A0A0V1LK56_9BILA|nr:hypothetical protein T02_952 [Trichinella nativa]